MSNENNLFKVPFPELLPQSAPMSDLAMSFLMAYQADKEYRMGIDTYDKNFGAICVVSKKDEVITVEYSRRLHTDDFEKEVEMVAKYYGIPTEQIMKEEE